MEWVPVLKDCLLEDTIKMKCEATDWEDQSEKVGRFCFDETGVNIKEVNVDAMVKFSKYMALYVITPHIALAQFASSMMVSMKIGILV